MRNFLSVLFLILVLASASNAASDIEEGFVQNGDHQLYFKTMGSGEPLVVLHGGPGFDHRTFLPYIWELAQNHKVILYDQRCTGLSTGPVDSTTISIETFIDDIEAIRKSFGIEKMNLMGHSWGGILAMYYSLQHEDQLKSLILCSTAASVQSFTDMRANYEQNRDPGDSEKLMEMYQSDGYQSGDPAVIEEFWQIYFKPYFKDKSLVNKMDLKFTENTIENSNQVAGLIMQCIGDFELHDQLKKLDCPTLIVHGKADPMPYKYAEQLHSCIAGSELVLIEDAGHWIFVDGNDVLSRSVLEFLSR